MKIPALLCAATLALVAAPAFAQPAETCLTRTLAGQPLRPAICFEAETLSAAGDEAMEDVMDMTEDAAPHASAQPMPPITPPPPAPVQRIYDRI